MNCTEIRQRLAELRMKFIQCQPLTAEDLQEFIDIADLLAQCAPSSGSIVQSDWTETDTADGSFIQNKPVIPVYQAGTNINIDNTNPAQPVISSTGGGGGSTPNLQSVLDEGNSATTAINLSGRNSNVVLTDANPSIVNTIEAAGMTTGNGAIQGIFSPTGFSVRNGDGTAGVTVTTTGSFVPNTLAQVSLRTDRNGIIAYLSDIPTGLQTVTVDVDQAQILAGTPVTVIPAPGNNMVIKPIDVTATITNSSTPYNQGQVVIFTDFNAPYSNTVPLGDVSSIPLNIPLNLAGRATNNGVLAFVSATNPGNRPTSGNGNIQLHITYMVHAIPVIGG